MRYSIYYLAFLFILLSSCSFNKMFLFPARISTESKEFQYFDKDSGQNIHVKITGSNYQPEFINEFNDTIDLGYTIESVVFKSKSGNLINGWFLKPKINKADITLLHMHGNAGCLFSQIQAISPMVKQNFQVFMFDYSGFGYSQGKATKRNVLNDSFSALDYIKSREDVKNTKLVIYGQSLGGHASAVVASQRQNDIDGLVVEGAFSSYKDIAAYKIKALIKIGFIGRILVKQSYCAKKSIKEYYKPLLVIHSTEDGVIPFYMGKEIYRNANEPKEFFEIKHEHICGPAYYSKEISDKIRKMFLN